jgi:hypothetical protein
VDEQIKSISTQIGNDTGTYSLKELCIYVMFKDITRKELLRKMKDFDDKMSNFNRGFVINDLDYFQMDAFANTRCYELPSIQFKKSY